MKKSWPSTRQLKNLSPTASVVATKRGIYFIKPEREVEMVDFALNLGFNDYYGAYSGQYINWSTKVKLGLRKH